MTTLIALLANRCGLSLSEGAAHLNVRLDTFKSWSSGRNPAKQGPIEELVALYGMIEQSADEALQTIESMTAAGDIVELGYCSDDYEAQHLGFPFASCHRAMLGLVVAKLVGRDIKLVPRGSSVGSAAAIQAHE